MENKTSLIPEISREETQQEVDESIENLKKETFQKQTTISDNDDEQQMQQSNPEIQYLQYQQQELNQEEQDQQQQQLYQQLISQEEENFLQQEQISKDSQEQLEPFRRFQKDSQNQINIVKNNNFLQQKQNSQENFSDNENQDLNEYNENDQQLQQLNQNQDQDIQSLQQDSVQKSNSYNRYLGKIGLSQEQQQRMLVNQEDNESNNNTNEQFYSWDLKMELEQQIKFNQQLQGKIENQQNHIQLLQKRNVQLAKDLETSKIENFKNAEEINKLQEIINQGFDSENSLIKNAKFNQKKQQKNKKNLNSHYNEPSLISQDQNSQNEEIQDYYQQDENQQRYEFEQKANRYNIFQNQKKQDQQKSSPIQYNQQNNLKTSSSQQLLRPSQYNHQYQKQKQLQQSQYKTQSYSQNTQQQQSSYQLPNTTIDEEDFYEKCRQVQVYENEIDELNKQVLLERREKLEFRNLLDESEQEIKSLISRNEELSSANLKMRDQVIIEQSKLKTSKLLEEKLQQDYCLLKEQLISQKEQEETENELIFQRCSDLLELNQQLQQENKQLLADLQFLEKIKEQNSKLKNQLSYCLDVELRQYRNVIDDLSSYLDLSDLPKIHKKIIKIVKTQKQQEKFILSFMEVMKEAGDVSSLNKNIEKTMNQQNQQDDYLNYISEFKVLDQKNRSISLQFCWAWFKNMFNEYLKLKKNYKEDKVLKKFLIEKLEIQKKWEILPKIQQKFSEFDTLERIVIRIKKYLQLQWVNQLPELERMIELQFQNKYFSNPYQK
ncbi:hypothetical protein PPERSA_07617 [Pseudocohnilembus persalinus]|uniref:Uncharacterized protein n=1 Tax=Pseudocohnilembus persalinus TaxID=266149 RepID=A0A0V0QIC9_PSEPJ|nr:hypothetical protein PPERSA_07617 [Pseudocohnilembus persalinus]|eukprot:KRX01972.1 hypothetical protein PPERSA_07617 [Pseudocohnilembus persalinus]